METPLITWSCIVALFVFMLLTKFIHAVVFRIRAKRPIIELGTEREEVYVPGDPLPLDDAGSDKEDTDRQ